MKPLKIGERTSHSFKVTEKDLATFADGNVHQVCSTFTIAREVEWCTRKFVLAHKDLDEEGVGTKLNIDHVSPAMLNTIVEIDARVIELRNSELICSFEARVGERIIAKGITGQKVLKKSRIKEIFSKFDEG